MHGSFRSGALSVLSLVVAIGCGEKSSSTATSDAPDAGAAKVESKVEKALANAVKASATESLQSSQSGPPADGVMEPARADAEIKAFAPPKLTVGSEGNAPKFRLRSGNASLPKRVSLELSIQGAGEQGIPPIEMVLSLESKPRSLAEKSDSKASDVVMTPGTLKVTARVREVRLSMPDLPKEFTEQLKGLKGGKIEFQLSPDGGGFGFSSTLAPGASSQLKDLLDAGAEGLALMTLPVPNIPVGVGAVWMVASRDSAAGFGLISYRMVKLTAATDKTAELEFDARRYAVGRAVDPSILPPGGPAGELRELSAAAKARFQLTADSLLASQMDGEAALRGAIGVPGEPRPAPRQGGQPNGQRMMQSATGFRVKVLP